MIRQAQAELQRAVAVARRLIEVMPTAIATTKRGMPKSIPPS